MRKAEHCSSSEVQHKYCEIAYMFSDNRNLVPSSTVWEAEHINKWSWEGRCVVLLLPKEVTHFYVHKEHWLNDTQASRKVLVYLPTSARLSLRDSRPATHTFALSRKFTVFVQFFYALYRQCRVSHVTLQSHFSEPGKTCPEDSNLHLHKHYLS